MIPEGLTHHAANAVPDHLRSHAASWGEANLNRNVGAHLTSRYHSVANLRHTNMDEPDIAPTFIEERPDKPAALQVVVAGKPVSGHSSTGWRLKPPGRLLARLRVADREFDTSFRATAGQDSSAVFGRHPRAEPVLVGALAAAGLIGALHKT